MSNFMDIRPVGAQSFHEGEWTDGQTDTTIANSRFAQFCEHA